MKKTIILGAMTAIICLSFNLPEKKAKLKKAKIMILGSYHMGNPGADLINMKVDDVLAPKRQKELESLAKMIAKFKPTKIAIEVGYQSKYDTLTNKNYTDYISGNNYNLTKNETEQIGFRLGKMLGHTKIYAIDEPGKFDFGKVMQFAMTNGQGESVQKNVSMAQEHIKTENERLLQTSIPVYLKEMNKPEMHHMAHDWYLKLLKVSKNKNYPGAELITGLYERNLKIVSNIVKITESPEERILVIYGNGHASFIKSILFGSSDYEIVESYNYL